MAQLFVIATPIGNLKDLSERAKNTLTSVDVVLCEDTRVTKKLLISQPGNDTAFKNGSGSLPGSEPRLISYHQHSGQMKTKKIIDLIEEGKSLALVTDAGTPGISDPGGKLIEELIKHFDDLEIIPIPGPSAITTILSVSGFPADEFLFMGFPPHKKGRQTFFNRLAKIESTIVLYESTHRIMKTLGELEKRIGNRKIVIGRELTKLHETIYRGTVADVTEQLKSTSIKGEFVIVISPT